MDELLVGRQCGKLPCRLVNVVIFILDHKIGIFLHLHRPGVGTQIDPLAQSGFGLGDAERLADRDIVLQHDPAHIAVGELLIGQPRNFGDCIAHGKHCQLHAHTEIPGRVDVKLVLQHRPVRIPDHLPAFDMVARSGNDLFDAGKQDVRQTVDESVAVPVKDDILRAIALADIVDQDAQAHLHRPEQL